MTKNPYVVLARKYRPQAFPDVIGQPAVSVTLQNALTSKRIHHAYLFTGPRGVGKTTMARLLAKGLDCVKGPTAQPCGECDPCREITASSCLDVLEMDAASHTGVDNVREAIIDTVALAPNRDRYKVFIIDEAHMLSGPAFNALLKTLEEPPAHVVFILATTEAAKIPATIASRCQRFRFRPVDCGSLREHLALLAGKEKIAVDPDALELLARSADGSLRDAVSLLDQCRSFTAKTVTAELVREMFGFVSEDVLLGLARALAQADAAGLAGWLKKVYEDGVESSQLLKDLRSGLQGVYLARVGMEDRTQAAWLRALEGVSTEQLRFLVDRANKVLEELRFTDSPRLALELGLFGALESAGDLAGWVRRLEDLEGRLSGKAAAPAPRPAGAPRVPAPAPVPAAALAGEIWPRLVAQLEEEKPSLTAILRSAKLAAQPDGSWKISFRRAFDLEQANRSKALIEAKLATLCGAPAQSVFEIEAGQEMEDVVDPGVVPGTGDRAPLGEWKDVTAPESSVQPPASLSRAEKILGGTAKFIKKKPAP
ncbi:MAG: DNA polymerase III subunit gamma/tau [Elusimicrobia bacterium]|nr:DNA polymerase III subunit gamma/tau [Elusimicrobiota bacterium]